MWAATSTFVVDDLHLGVRSTSAALDGALRAALAAHLAEDVDAPPNYSVQLGDAAPDGATGFHFLYRSSTAVVRTRDVRRAMAALLTHLSSHGADPAPGLVRVQGVTLVAGDRAVLAPSVLRQWPELIERRLNGRGLRIADTPWALVDPARAEVVVPEPALTVDAHAFEALDALVGRHHRDDPPVPPGRYPLAGWAFWLTRDDPLTRARALVHALQLRMGAIEPEGAEGVQRALDELAAVVRNVAPAAIAIDDPVGVVEPLAALASTGGSR